MFLSIRYFFVTFFLLRFASSLSQVILNEIMFDPVADEPEWIELHNPTDHQIDLQGWRIADADTSRKIIIADTVAIFPLSGFVVVSEDSSILNRFPFLQDQVYVPKAFPRLNNDFDTVFLFDSSGILIEYVAYGNNQCGGNGISIERISPRVSADDPTNWSPCVSIEGATPGGQNSVWTSTILPNATLSVCPNPFSPDNDGFEDVTEITYHLPVKIAHVNLHIYDVHGRRIRTFMGGTMSGSQGSIYWDGRDDQGRESSMGIYIIFLEALESMAGEVLTVKRTVVLGGKL
ncbi:lamin tail domain-containing protein [bacterium]|nr:lamin tail domain-containing protein [bacterium]